ncbi:protein kinase [Corallococcus sp. AS-1-12]|uniref:protein kinase domain-containing protein n=1 Tax=Corallococcus sp. AS-1-12 TaxID=2874598 RepID=UPI001CBFA40D|nr:protein kinase [Corallococcus sp. AS-1-12]MBZ4334778.1 protein kinase [Corallococcus sp. AS-1-12]
MSVLPFATRLPAFAPLHPLGRGPLGEWVSLVWPLEPDASDARPLVVKTFLLASGLAPETRRPLEEALARALPLRHPGIARLHGFQVDVRDTLTVVSDYVPGCSLATARRRVLGRGGRPSEAFVCHVGAEVAGALQAAHGARVVHGDVHAHRVRVGPRGEVTLTDFGLGRARPLLRRFMSPTRQEAVEPPVREGAVGSPGEDLRALGRVLVELVCGNTVVPEDAAGVDAALGGVSPALRDVLRGVLEARGADSAVGLQGALRDCLGHGVECHGRDSVVRELAALPGSGPLSPVDVYVGAASVMTASASVRGRTLPS